MMGRNTIVWLVEGNGVCGSLVAVETEASAFGGV